MNKLSIDEIFNAAIMSLKTEPHPSELFPHITYYRFHRELIKLVQPEVAVELGVAAGGTSLHMCVGCPEAKVIGIDRARPDKWDKHIAYIENTHKNYEFWQMDTVMGARRMWERYQKPVVGYLYVDALHEKKQVYLELRSFKRLMLDGAIVVFDDLYLTQDMQEMWAGLPFTEKIRLDFLHVEVGYGAAIWRNAEIRGW